MKRYILLLLMLGCGLIARAQIIQGATVTVENAARNATTRGYKGYIEAGVGVNLLMSPKFIYEFTTTHGYRFEHLFLGVGTGVTTHLETGCDRLYALPFFGEARWLFNNDRKWKIFAGMKIGYDLHLGKYHRPINSEHWYYRLKGLYLSPGCGIEYGKLTLSLNYLIRSVNIDYEDRNWREIHTKSDYDNSTLLLRIGVNF